MKYVVTDGDFERLIKRWRGPYHGFTKEAKTDRARLLACADELERVLSAKAAKPVDTSISIRKLWDGKWIARLGNADIPELFDTAQGALDAIESFTQTLGEPVAVPDDNAELMCCNGNECGCRGLTKGQYRATLLAKELTEPMAYYVPNAMHATDGSFDDGPGYYVYAPEASEYEIKIGFPLYAAPHHPITEKGCSHG